MDEQEQETEQRQEKVKITFLSLIAESLLSLFLANTTSEKDEANYPIKEKWKIWFEGLINPATIKRRKNKVFNFIVKFLIVFGVINLFIFVPIVLQQLKSPRFPVARAYLKSSLMVDQLYIVPLSKLFGYGNFLTWPFYPIKEGLYNLGMSKLPKDEGEREFWWFNVRFVEYMIVVQPTLMDSYTYIDKTYKPLPKWQVKSFEKWDDELYSHILSWPNAKISDPKLKKEKLIRFVDVVDAYIRSTCVLSTKLQIINHRREEFPDHLPNSKPEAVKNYMNVINIFNNLKERSAKNDKESYNYFEKNKKYYEDKFLYRAALELIQSEMQWGSGVSCKSPEVNILATSHKNLRNYYVKNYNNLKFGEKGTLSILIGGPIKIPVCTEFSASTEYEQFRQKYSDYIKTLGSGKYNNLVDLFK